jgi:hypothetical protein
MPFRGLSFQLEGKEYTDASRTAVRNRINALLDYLESIQESRKCAQTAIEIKRRLYPKDTSYIIL